jgi:hypothetical protein
VTEATRVNRGVAYALAQQLPRALAARERPRSRFWDRLRRAFNQQARLTTITADGRIPDRDQHIPSVRQISKFLTWATAVKAPTHHPPADVDT